MMDFSRPKTIAQEQSDAKVRVAIKRSLRRMGEPIPTRCVAEIVNRLKGASSRILRQEFPHLVSRMPTLWSRSYYAGTVGHVSKATVKKYIENQKGR